MNESNNEINQDNRPSPEELKELLASVCESMCKRALELKPKDLPAYMINFLKSNYGYSPSGLREDEKKELEKLRSEVEVFREMDEHAYYHELQKQLKKEQKIEKKGKNPPKPKPKLPPDEVIVSDDEDYIDEDIDMKLDNIEYIKECSKNNRRTAVCDRLAIEGEDKGKINFNKKSLELTEAIRIKIMKSPIFSEMPLDAIKQCIDAMEEKTVPAVNDVFKQGDIGDEFYFVLEGELECKMMFTKIIREGNRKKIEKSEQKLVKIYGPGDYFGELSLLYTCPRRCSVKTVTDTKLYILNRIAYKKIISNSNNNQIQRRTNIFKNIPIFCTLSDEEIDKLHQIAKEAIFYNGDIIVKENEYSNIMYYIEKGKCIGTQTKEPGKLPEKVKDYKEGDIIDEKALLRPEKRQENIIANSEIVKMLCIDRYTFKNNLGSLEPILMRNIEFYHKIFPIIEEKPEEKNEEQQNPNPNEPNNALNNNQINLNNQNSQQNLLNVNNQNSNVTGSPKQAISQEEVDKIINETKEKCNKEHMEEVEKLNALINDLKAKYGQLENKNEDLEKQLKEKSEQMLLQEKIVPVPEEEKKEEIPEINDKIENEEINKEEAKEENLVQEEKDKNLVQEEKDKNIVEEEKDKNLIQEEKDKNLIQEEKDKNLIQEENDVQRSFNGEENNKENLEAPKVEEKVDNLDLLKDKLKYQENNLQNSDNFLNNISKGNDSLKENNITPQNLNQNERIEQEEHNENVEPGFTDMANNL